MALLSPVQALGAGVAAFAAYSIALVIYRLFFHPLAKFPGPKIAAATLWYEAYYDVLKKPGGMYIWEIARMHEQYGPIVRVNPHELHIKDPSFYDEIYAGTTKKRDKYPGFLEMGGAPGSGFATVGHDLHRVRRGAMSQFFAKRSIVRLEPRISEKVANLCGRLREYMEAERVVDLETAFTALTLDVIAHYSYGRSYDYVKQDDFNQAWRDAMVLVLQSTGQRRNFSAIYAAMDYLPLSVILKLLPAIGTYLVFKQEIARDVEAVFTKEGEKRAGESQESMFEAIMNDDDLSPSDKTVQRMVGEGEVLLAAGSETTAKTLAWTTFYLLNDADAVQKLRVELKAATFADPEAPSCTELERLPYLTGVIKEGLRLSYGVVTRLPRCAHEPLQYGKWYIPAMTPLSQSSYFVHTDPSIFPEPEKFTPERWMQKDSHKLDRYMVAFTRGTRACLGINLAYAELYLALATVIRKFDFELYETSVENVVFARDTFTPMPKVGFSGVKVLVKKEVQ